MSKIELDDMILDHPKFVRAAKLAGSDAVFLWLGLRAYCAKMLTDGFVPEDMIEDVRGPKDSVVRATALQALRDSDLVDDADGGIYLHDYLDWAPSRDQVLAWRKANAERKARSRGRATALVTVGVTRESRRDNGNVTVGVTRESRRSHTGCHGGSHSGVPAPSLSSSSSSSSSSSDSYSNYQESDDSDPVESIQSSDSDSESLPPACHADVPIPPSDVQVDPPALQTPSEDQFRLAPIIPHVAPTPKPKRARVAPTKVWMSADWVPSDARIDALVERTGVPKLVLLKHVPEFRLYWLPGGKGAERSDACKRACDWDQTFANWVDKLIEWGKIGVTEPRPPQSGTRFAGVKTPRRVQPNAVNGPMPEEWTEDSE